MIDQNSAHGSALTHAHTETSGYPDAIAYSDLLTAIAYFVIPVALALFLYRHKEIQFKRILVLFMLFILACGFQHLLHFTQRWWPASHLMTGAMVVMAAVSVVTAVVIWPVLRQVSAFLHERVELQDKLQTRNQELESALALAEARKRALEESETAFRCILDDAPIGMAVVTLGGSFSIVNRALCDIVGYRASELKNLTFQEITHPDDLDSDNFQVGLLLDGVSQNYRLEKRYIRSSGEIIDVQLDVSLVRNDKNEPRFFVSQIQDITARKRTREALRQSRYLFDSLLRNLPTAVVVHRPDSSIEFANPAATRLLGLSEEQLLGRSAVDPYWRFVREDGSDMPLDEYPVMKVINDKRPLTNYLTGLINFKDAPVGWMLVNAFPIKSAAGALDRIIVSFIDITERKALQQALEEQAQTDSLTGLFNRRYFDQVAARELAYARRTEAPLSLLVLDLDHFKHINDRYGHTVGDSVLIRFCDIIRQTVRETDIACRFGGEEFIILAPNTDLQQAVRLAERLRKNIQETRIERSSGPSVRWTASIGVSCLSPEDMSIESVITRADAELYRAKSGGRNCVCYPVQEREEMGGC